MDPMTTDTIIMDTTTIEPTTTDPDPYSTTTDLGSMVKIH